MNNPKRTTVRIAATQSGPTLCVFAGGVAVRGMPVVVAGLVAERRLLGLRGLVSVRRFRTLVRASGVRGVGW